jgi:hypothetical protein
MSRYYDPITLVGRGDPAISDKTEANLILDSTWRDLDLSAIVPATATWILLRASVQAASPGKRLFFRKNGNINGYNFGGVRTQVAGVSIDSTVYVECDSNRVIEYYADSGLSIDIVIAGWDLPKLSTIAMTAMVAAARTGV